MEQSPFFFVELLHGQYEADLVPLCFLGKRTKNEREAIKIFHKKLFILKEKKAKKNKNIFSVKSQLALPDFQILTFFFQFFLGKRTKNEREAIRG